MNISIQSLVLSVTNCIIQLSLLIQVILMDLQIFGLHAVLPIFLLVFGMLTTIGSWHDMKYPFKATSDKLTRRSL
ncbi:Uncharacterised protein [Salmonella enterica subsp. enterica]|uniref:Uncharacterized protein n=1 Tax=Salmonella enterica I TaxID=59201 RepID=A0A379Y1S4_SALET|nr:Uncharacterised protein [Salmonella enterica subsp. enterica]